ncbi:MAG: hypoxanthine phosphoribosyltransferase [Chloroflexi bacterium]|nr:hypoxanthine phosphoribosyltransferase [Chloroflexota bacterium]
MNALLQNVDRVLISQEELQKRVRELGAQVSADYRDLNPLLLCVLKGGFLFLADLSRALTIRHGVDFMAISSYGNSTVSSGVVRILKDLDTDITGRHVLIVEDIIDTGQTLAYLLENLRVRQPASVRICALLTKPARRQVPLQIDYVGFEIPDEFVIGYGLDFAEDYRNLPFIGVLKREVYASSH